MFFIDLYERGIALPGMDYMKTAYMSIENRPQNL
jgi:hypothetical protein